MKRLFLLVLLSTFSFVSMAGSRGYYFVVVNIGEIPFYESKTNKAFLKGDEYNLQKIDDCWNKRIPGGAAPIDVMAVIKRPKGLDKEIGLKIWNGDKAALNEARKILRKEDKYSRPEGYDGMYIENFDGKTLTMMSIGARGGMTEKITIPIDEANPKKSAGEYEYALCRLAKPFNIGFGV